MSRTFSLSRKETFSVSMVIFIGFFYLVSLASALFQGASFSIKKDFGIVEIKFLLLGIFFWSGALSFFKLKPRGWIICAATLLNFVIVLSQFVINVSQGSRFTAYAAIVIATFLLVLAAFVFLFNKESRIKFQVKNSSYLLVIGVYCVLLAATFLL